jgi:predicted HNH restriction endonuclease
MGINHFFENVLGGKVRNYRWSWGAVDEETWRVFLRIWSDQIDQNTQKVQIYWKNPTRRSHGYAERIEQISLLDTGAKGFGIWTEAVDVNPEGARVIRNFRKDALFELGDLSEDETGIYAKIIREIPTNQIIATRPIPSRQIPSREELSRYNRIVLEGARGTITVSVRRRCEALRKRAREFYRNADGKLRCKVCGWHKPNHGVIGDIVELHHVEPLAELPLEGVQRCQSDAINWLSPLCPSCHRIAHSRAGGSRRLFTLCELQYLIPKHPLFSDLV